MLISSRGASQELVYDKVAEGRLRRKIDLMILPTVCILYLCCFIDRANIGTYLDFLYSQ